MRRTALALATALMLAAPAYARDLPSCDVETRFDLSVESDRLVFAPERDPEHTIVMSRGTLNIDGRNVDVSAADRERLLDYEAGVRALVPEIKGIALDAIELASEAMLEVAALMSKDGAGATIERMREQRDLLRRKVENSNNTRDWNEQEFEQAVEAMVTEVVPELVGQVTASAIAAAMRGDESFAADIEKRAAEMERRIEKNIEARARLLEERGDALCPQLHALEDIERSFDARLPDGSRIDLLEVES